MNFQNPVLHIIRIALLGVKYFKALDTCGNTNNPEADQLGSYLHPLTCQWPPTWPLPHPSLAACQG